MASPLIIATLAAGMSGFPAPQADLRAGAVEAPIVRVASDCTGAVSRVVRETGGQLLSVYPSGDGQSCVVTVLVQGNGERPRKVTMRVPMQLNLDRNLHTSAIDKYRMPALLPVGLKRGRRCAFSWSRTIPTSTDN